MYYYFSSDYPALLKINGLFYGNLFNTVKHLEILGDTTNTLVEILPLVNTETPVTFILNDNFFTCPPINVSLTDLDGGYLIKVTPSFNTLHYAVLAQKKFPDLLVTAFNDNGHKLCLENGFDFYSERIYHNVNSVEIVKSVCSVSSLVAVVFKGENLLVSVYDVKEKISKIFSKLCDDVQFNEHLVIRQDFLDIAKHSLTNCYAFSDNQFILSNTTLSVKKDFCLSSLNKSILPYAFLEHFMLGGDISEYVGKNILDNKEQLRGYLGNFLGVMPPPLFKDITEVGLIYHEKDNLYKVKYFSFEIEDRKIVNVIKR